MIKSITMKNCATYIDEQSLLDLKKINFIYGANGSGKTTISNYLYNQNNEMFSECSIEKNDNTLILVYNKQFREDHFKDDIDGIFTMGKATKEQIEEVEKLKKTRDEISVRLSGYQNDFNRSKEDYVQKNLDLMDSIWEIIFKKYEKDLLHIFDGYRNSKKKFYNEFEKKFKNRKIYDGTYDELIKRYSTLYVSSLVKYDEIEIAIDNNLEEIENIINDEIWNKVVVGNKDVPLAKFISKLNNEDWVQRGRLYLDGSNKCPFCQKDTIDAEFIQNLEILFDESYESSINRINELYNLYSKNTEKLLKEFHSIILIDDAIRIGKLDAEKYNLALSKLEQCIIEEKENINKKVKEPSRKVTINSLKENIRVLLSLIQECNINIENHNLIVANVEVERNKLIDDVWNYCIKENEQFIDTLNNELNNLNKKINGLERTIENTKKSYDEKEKEILDKSRNITSVEPTVQEINKLLKSFNFTGFKIVPSKEKSNSYQIQRENGELVKHTLSEGEETFISFLYFLQLVKGGSDLKEISSKKIVVIDDPISSLDSNILYIVSTMVKGLAHDIKNNRTDVKQLIVLTHNIFFHKEVSYFNGRNDKCNDVNYWIISKNKNMTNIISYGITNPISTSYELLWRELKNNNISSISIQNIMRRILENYFSLLGKKYEDEILDKFDDQEDKKVCRSLLAWINDGSHSIDDNLYIANDEETIEKYMEVFKQIFDKTQNIGHYNMMMRIQENEDE